MTSLRKELNLAGDLRWDDIGETLMEGGSRIEQGKILFTKIEDEQVEEQLQKLKERSVESSPEEQYETPKDNMEFDEFMKMDLRAGKITHASAIEEADKLLKLTIDLGFEQRTIVSGIANDFSAADIVGQRVCVVANLAPKKLMGVESNGMILMAEEDDGSLKFVETDAKPGSVIS
ncbi:MAG TPA: methionine--tRNA ligase subunit beta, partial [Fodinibius sp.]|nr:methionine--tRNA ligase subunit beta [Fodinibius sp.]